MKQITLKLSKDDLMSLKNLFAILNDAFELNRSIDESCLALLLELRKPEKKKYENFIYSFGKYLSSMNKSLKCEDC